MDEGKGKKEECAFCIVTHSGCCAKCRIRRRQKRWHCVWGGSFKTWCNLVKGKSLKTVRSLGAVEHGGGGESREGHEQQLNGIKGKREGQGHGFRQSNEKKKNIYSCSRFD